MGPFTLVYNKDLLDKQIAKYNLDSAAVYAYLDPKTPMTWNQFRELLKKIDPDGGKDNVYGISHYEIEAAVYSNDANFFNDDASQQTITDDVLPYSIYERHAERNYRGCKDRRSKLYANFHIGYVPDDKDCYCRSSYLLVHGYLERLFRSRYILKRHFKNDLATHDGVY